MGCQCSGICGTTKENHFPHLSPCLSQPKHTSDPHWAGTAMLGQPEGCGYTRLNPPNSPGGRRAPHPTRAQLTP